LAMARRITSWGLAVNWGMAFLLHVVEARTSG